MPKLANDFRRAQVAVETLSARGAESTCQGAADLGGDAQRAAVGFRDEDGLDRVALTDIEQPLARAVGRNGIANRHRATNLRLLRQAQAQRLGHVSHLPEIVATAAMHPAQHLASPERLLAQAREPCSQAFGVEVEQIDHGRTSGRSRR